MNVSASKVAQLIGANPYDKIHEGWVSCLKLHNNMLYRALVDHDAKFILSDEKALNEISSMPKEEQSALKKARLDVSEGRVTPMEAFKIFKLSNATRKNTISQAMCSVGTNQEAEGLRVTTKCNQESAIVLKNEIQTMRTSLVKQKVRQDEVTTDIAKAKKTLENVEETRQKVQDETCALQNQKDETNSKLMSSERKLFDLEQKLDMGDGDEKTVNAIEMQKQTIETLKADIHVNEEKTKDAMAKLDCAIKTAQEMEGKLKDSLILKHEIQSSIVSTELKISKNLTQAQIFELPIKPCPKLFKLVKESFVLTGKIDGLREHGDLLYIVEHKRRQAKLFQTIRVHEKIQCMCYMKLMMHEYPKKRVRCLLAETFKGTEANHEIIFDTAWMDSIIEFLNNKSAELLCLAAAADVAAIANWMDALQPLSL